MLSTDAIYDHSEYGEVLVSNIIIDCTAFDPVTGTAEQADGPPRVLFYQQWDDWGGLRMTPQSAPAPDFADNATFVEDWEYDDSLLNDAVDTDADADADADADMQRDE